MSHKSSGIYDVLIIGAGPCGLAVAARLREGVPASMFTDDQHQLHHRARQRRSNASAEGSKSGRNSQSRDNTEPELRIGVLDAHGDEWLGQWKQLFGAYEISHLRSPMLWHVDPQDPGSPLALSYREERQDETIEIVGCVGSDVGRRMRKKRTRQMGKGGSRKHQVDLAINERERNDFSTPSQALFIDHCHDVFQRYGLHALGLIHREEVLDIKYEPMPALLVGGRKLFKVATNISLWLANVVILAAGSANAPSLPRIPLLSSSCVSGPRESGPIRQALHSSQIRRFPEAVVCERIQKGLETNVLVIGGGLTSAQLTDLAIRRGVAKRNRKLLEYWSAISDSERLEMLLEARGGGSITPLYHVRLQEHIAKGRLELRTQTVLAGAHFDVERGAWTVQTDPRIPMLPPIDFIYFAAGVQTDYCALPYLQSMIKAFPIQGCGGFAAINDDMMWRDDVPLFLTGKLAALRLGPSAANLEGAKTGAERIMPAVQDMINRSSTFREAERGGAMREDRSFYEYSSGRGNKFSNLQNAF